MVKFQNPTDKQKIIYALPQNPKRLPTKDHESDWHKTSLISTSNAT